MKPTHLLAAALGFGVALGFSSFAMADNDAAASLAKAPAAVQAAAKAALGDKKLEEFDKEILDDKVEYEVGWKEAGVDHAAILDESGKLIQTEVDVELEKLPKAVTDAIAKARPDGKLDEAAIATADGKQFYSIDVKVGKVLHVIDVTADGQALGDSIEKSAPQAKEDEKKD